MNELSMRSTVCSKVEKEAHFAPEALIVVPSMVSVRTLDSPISMEIMVCRTDSLFTGGHGVHLQYQAREEHLAFPDRNYGLDVLEVRRSG